MKENIPELILAGLEQPCYKGERQNHRSRDKERKGRERD